MATKPEFKGDRKKPINSITGRLEQRLIHATIRMIPRWIEGYHLTLMTIPWSAGLIYCGYLAQANRNWLWLSSALIFLQWFTDSYDGALGRLRDTGIPKWGYHMDHFLDYVFLCAILIGYSFLFGDSNVRNVFLILAISVGFMMNSYISFAATTEFKITFLGFGPTEGRLLFIIFNGCLIFFGVEWARTNLFWAVPVLLIGLVVVVYRTQSYIWKVDMADKAARTGGGSATDAG
jgi:archaetidylinositol phosphate synthase